MVPGRANGMTGVGHSEAALAKLGFRDGAHLAWRVLRQEVD
jgi:hypothetical protein